MSEPTAAYSKIAVEPVRHHPELLTGGRRAWCNCACGWRSGTYSDKGSAHLAFGRHLLDAAFGEPSPDHR